MATPHFRLLQTKLWHRLCWFSVAAVTNHHKLIGLKQHQFVISLFLFFRLEVQHGSHQIKIKTPSGLCPFCRPWNRMLPGSSQHLESVSISQLTAACLHLYTQLSLSQDAISLFLPLLPLFSTLKNSCDYIGLI